VIEAATAFFKCLKVYPRKTDLISMFDKTVPKVSFVSIPSCDNHSFFIGDSRSVGFHDFNRRLDWRYRCLDFFFSRISFYFELVYIISTILHYTSNMLYMCHYRVLFVFFRDYHPNSCLVKASFPYHSS
jgi:hypothetical protein